ncbi:MAG: PilT/PilU family type 4a pilus ATPase [Candidatus Eisenbacteria bacterium]|uniref:PilT/PilU family type 4a pilus ATPase n=1 Tax=Eiseniibacteriota bacterium TaxID=2212470 RepID=A0A7Y2H244_UNCEI|nr:PilT/PilU family type 4a pilus ATPase [Candidatus Eisenbacteria bacterium]
MNIKPILEDMIQAGASDLHIKAGTAPTIRVDGSLVSRDSQGIPTSAEIDELVAQILTPKQQQEFADKNDIDFAFSIPGLCRFRANFYRQRGTVAMAFRTVPFGVPTLEDLGLPDVLKELGEKPRGLVLVTGTVGSGKSTTLASIIDYLNRNVPRNIITIEDPVEFLHRDDKCMISQREVGMDTSTYAGGLKYILRQDPDVILIGEIRDPETMRVAVMAADTGHLVLSTLHTPDAPQTINRIISFFPLQEHEEVRYLLASNLAAVVSLRLVPKADGKGRVPAAEVMLNTETIKEYIRDSSRTPFIHKAIAEGVSQYGMQTFDQDLLRLYREDLISFEEAMKTCTNPTEFELRVKGIHSASDTSWDSFDAKRSA